MFFRYSWHVSYLKCPLLGGFTVSNIRAVTGNIFNTPVSLLPSSIKLNGNFFKSAIRSNWNWSPTQLTIETVFASKHEKFSAARLPLNSLFMYGVRLSDKLKSISWWTTSIAILTWARIARCIEEVVGASGRRNACKDKPERKKVS